MLVIVQLHNLLLSPHRTQYSFSLAAVEDTAHRQPLSALTGTSLRWELVDWTRYNGDSFEFAMKSIVHTMKPAYVTGLRVPHDLLYLSTCLKSTFTGLHIILEQLSKLSQITHLNCFTLKTSMQILP